MDAESEPSRGSQSPARAHVLASLPVARSALHSMTARKRVTLPPRPNFLAVRKVLPLLSATASENERSPGEKFVSSFMS